MAEQIQNQNAGTQTPGAQQNNNAQQQNQPVQGTVTVNGNGQQQGQGTGMTINLDQTMLAQLLSNPAVQAGLANGQTVPVGNALQQQQMMQQLQGQGVQVPPVAPQIPGAAPSQNQQQPAGKPGILARMKNGVLQFIVNNPGWTIIITVAATALITLGCVYLYNRYFSKATTQAVVDNNRKFEEARNKFATETNTLANRDNYQKVGLGNPQTVAKSLCMRLY